MATEASHADNSTQDDHAKALAAELPKILLTNNLELIRGTMQALQGLTSILLTAYIALLVGFRKDVGLHDNLTLVVAFLPIVCWSGSLFWGFVSAGMYLRRGSRFVYGDIVSTVRAYEEVVRRRLQQLLWPAIFTFVGLICFVVSFLIVFLPSLGPR